MAALALGTLLVLVPLWLVQFPAMIDYPVHLARQWILATWAESSALQANYRIDWGLKPNLAMDLLTPWLATVMPLPTAAKVFTAMAMLAPVLGAGVLAAVLRGHAPLAMLLALCGVYNLALSGGFLNFLFGTGLALMAFAMWFRGAGQTAWQQILLGCLACLVLFFAHLFALLVYLVVVSAFELETAYRQRQRAARCLLAILSLAIVTGLLWWLKPDGPPHGNFFYGTLVSRVRAVFSPVQGLFPITDLVLLLLSLVGAFLIYQCRHRLSLHPSLRWPVVALAGVACLIPQAVGGGAVLAIRLPIAIAFVLIAGLTVAGLSARAERVLVLIVLLFLSLRSVDVAWHWQAQDQRYQEFWQASALMAPGARVLALQEPRWNKQTLLDSHVVTLSVMSRCAFVPHMAKLRDQHPIAPAQATVSIDGGTAAPVSMAQLRQGIDFGPGNQAASSLAWGWSRPYFQGWPDHFDYLVHLDPAQADIPLAVRQNLAVLHRGTFFVIYRVLSRAPTQGLNCPPA